RHQLLDDRAQVLRLRQRGDNLLMLDQRGGEMLEQRGALVRAAAELAVGIAVTHLRTPFREWRTGDWRMEKRAYCSLFATHYSLSNDPRSAWPALRCSPAASRALPCRD